MVFSAWQGDSKAELITALEAAVRPLLSDGAQLALRRDALEDAIEDAAAAVDATPLIILDQFEERFVYGTDDDGFDDELAHCINRRDLRANFPISVREDAYPQLGPRFKARIANVYGNYLHLDFLDERAARDAILEPVNASSTSASPGDAPCFEVEGALVDAVVEQAGPRARHDRRRRRAGHRGRGSGSWRRRTPARHEALVGRGDDCRIAAAAARDAATSWAAWTRSSTATSTT